jgi:hypothetical protein
MRSLILSMAILAGVTRSVAADPGASDIEALRRAALEDIFLLQDYRPGKNSFVESPERHLGAWTNAGFRYTLAHLEGQGSIRHIWTTRGEGEPYFDWEIFVDGETRPSIRGTDVELVAAAERYPIPVAPANAVPLGNRDFNFFLPIPFDQSCRIDVVQREPSFWLWFCQIDYRLEDDSLAGARLISHPSDSGIELSYVGLPQQRRRAEAAWLPRHTATIDEQTIAPGTEKNLLRIEGPGIVRQLRLRWSDPTVRLRLRFDDADGFAVDSPIDRFFGPFDGVSYQRQGTNEASCFLPMPFRSNCRVVARNDGTSAARVSGSVESQIVPSWNPRWGYFHAKHQRTDRTTGHRPHQVLYARGRGHWLGMTLYHTGHDHGGGDFAVIDGETIAPSFLHGINGEDYFTFAWFGKGAHHPYAVAHSNDEGRYRHHFENVYPFEKSVAIEWGAFADLSPESVAVWYQDAPDDTTVPDGARTESAIWDVFGPVPIPHDERGRSLADPFSVLPSVAQLDSGETFECRLVKERFFSGWQQEWAVGPFLNLTYLGRHGTKIDYEAELGGMGHAMLARRQLEWHRRETVPFLFSHDDPIELWINGQHVYSGVRGFNGFENHVVQVPLQKGRNEVVVKLSNYFNRNFNWAGFLLRPIVPELDRAGVGNLPVR